MFGIFASEGADNGRRTDPFSKAVESVRPLLASYELVPVVFIKVSELSPDFVAVIMERKLIADLLNEILRCEVRPDLVAGTFAFYRDA